MSNQEITQNTRIYITYNENTIFHICLADSEEQAIQYTDEYIGVDREDPVQSMYKFEIDDVTINGIDPIWDGNSFYEDLLEEFTVLHGQLNEVQDD